MPGSISITNSPSTWDRSAYSLPLIEILLAAKFKVPAMRNLPSVEILISTSPLNTSCDVYAE